MGQLQSYEYGGQGKTSEAACNSLEHNLKMTFGPESLVRMTEESEFVPVLSPRSVGRMAVAVIPGKGDIPVKLVRRDCNDFTATILIKGRI